MGVIKRPLLNSAQHAYMIQDTASETTESVSVASVQAVRVPRCRRRRRVRVDASDVFDDDVEEHVNRLGARQARRLANVQFLLNLADKLGKADDKVGPYESSSLFADLFKDREKMVFWQEFSSLSEERQLRLLDKFARTQSAAPSLEKIEEDSEDAQADETDKTAIGLPRESDADSSDYGFELVARPATETRLNPCIGTSGTAVRFCDCETCFARIQSRFRTLLRRRDAPRGLLDSLEQQLTNFFVDAPDAICVLSLSSAYERLCAHIVSEWLGLRAQSMDGDMRAPLSRCARRKAVRCTVVENTNVHFVPPEKRLVCYLDERDAKRIGAVRLEG